MDKAEHIEYWLDSAAHDLDVAEVLYQNQKYDWRLFIGHFVIEKVLKAVYVRDKDKIPPKIHNLPKLAENTRLELSDDQKLWHRKKSEKAVSCHSRVNGNPVFSSSYVLLDSCLRRNDDFLRVHQKLFLIDLSGFNLEARYPDQKLQFYKLCTKEFTEINFAKIKGFYKWLLLQMKQ